MVFLCNFHYIGSINSLLDIIYTYQFTMTIRKILLNTTQNERIN